MPETLTLTSKMGTFEFDGNVHLSWAKLIRDAITGHFFHPRLGEPRIHTEKDAYSYAEHHLSNDLAAVGFDLVIDPKFSNNQ